MVQPAVFKPWQVNPDPKTVGMYVVTGVKLSVIASDSEYPSQPPSLMERVIHYIQSHYREPISLYDVARAVGRSPAYLTDRVRRETGRTVLRWIIDCRMQEAQHLLKETEMTVYGIANVLGYTDTSHFIRQFRQYYGVSPQMWRDRHRG